MSEMRVFVRATSVFPLPDQKCNKCPTVGGGGHELKLQEVPTKMPKRLSVIFFKTLMCWYVVLAAREARAKVIMMSNTMMMLLMTRVILAMVTMMRLVRLGGHFV